MELIVADSRAEASRKLAGYLAEALIATPRLRLCLSAGRTSVCCYEHLVRRYHEPGGPSFRNAMIFGTDDYVGLRPDDFRSTRYILNYHLFNQVDIPGDQTVIMRGDATDLEAECRAFDLTIAARGGLDLVVLGLGYNGHVALNEPGSSLRSRSRQVTLTFSTIASLSDGTRFARAEDVPAQGLTIGMASIMAAREVLLIGTGVGKAEAMRRLVLGRPGTSFPASLLRAHPRLTVFADSDAISSLSAKQIAELRS